jgi:hypothetical protein
MNYSFLHQNLAIQLNRIHNINKQDVLEHPEKYLGPNYKEVLNFCFYCDSLSYGQKEVYWVNLDKLCKQTQREGRKLAEELSAEAIDPRFVEHLSHVSLEIISSHLYIERNIPFTFLPLIFDL